MLFLCLSHSHLTHTLLSSSHSRARSQGMKFSFCILINLPCVEAFNGVVMKGNLERLYSMVEDLQDPLWLINANEKENKPSLSCSAQYKTY